MKHYGVFLTKVFVNDKMISRFGYRKAIERGFEASTARNMSVVSCGENLDETLELFFDYETKILKLERGAGYIVDFINLLEIETDEDGYVCSSDLIRAKYPNGLEMEGKDCENDEK